MIKIIILSLQLFIAPKVTLHANILPIVGSLSRIHTGDLYVTSNYRTVEKNRQVGGVNNSKHLCGKAIDIRLRGLSKKAVLNLLKLSNKYDVVVESNHIHIETKEDC